MEKPGLQLGQFVVGGGHGLASASGITDSVKTATRRKTDTAANRCSRETRFSMMAPFEGAEPTRPLTVRSRAPDAGRRGSAAGRPDEHLVSRGRISFAGSRNARPWGQGSGKIILARARMLSGR